MHEGSSPRDEGGGNPNGDERRLLDTLEHLLDIRATDLKGALDEASDLVAEAVGADKADAFLLDPASTTLVAMGTSDTPMGRQQHRLGLNRVPVANSGRAVEVFQTGDSYRTGHADEDPHVPCRSASPGGEEPRWIALSTVVTLVWD